MSAAHVRFGHVSEQDTEPEKVDLETLDVTAANRAAFEQQFPGVLADGVIDAERLKELLDVNVVGAADDRERYGLMWAGKKKAVRSLQTTSRGALLPEFDKSKKFDVARHAFIEGDNLEVLKLLQKAYNDKVRLIYIDPPYNTSNDFVYNDDFSDGLRSYLEYTGQMDGSGIRTSASADTAGRRHSRWLSMMYPRLVLARNLLTQDGVIFVSIGDDEVSNLRLIMDELFGAENALPIFTRVTKRSSNNGATFSPCTDFVLGYARNVDELGKFSVPLTDDQIRSYNKSDGRGAYKEIGLYQAALKHGGSRYAIETPDGTLAITPEGRPWRWSKSRFQEGLANDEIVFKKSDRSPLLDAESGEPVGWNIYTKLYLADREGDGLLPKSFLVDYQNSSGSRELRNLGIPFDFPKPSGLVKYLAGLTGATSGIVLDFFAGAGATGQAVIELNEEDGGDRQYVLVQLPEPVADGSDAAKAGYSKISELTRARLHRVSENTSGSAPLRSFSLRPSCFRDAAKIEPEELFDLRESTLEDGGHSVEELAGEVLLKEGVRLDATWERHKAAGAPMIVADGVAVVMSLELTQEIADAALELKPKVVVFLEDGFAEADAVKANTFTNAKNADIVMKTV